MIIKTKGPLNRVRIFIKGLEEHSPDRESDSESQAPGQEPAAEDEMEADTNDGAIHPETVEKIIRERLEEERLIWEKETENRVREACEKQEAEGRVQAEKEIAEKAAQLAGVIAELKTSQIRLQREGEEAVVDLALAVGRRFVDSAAVLSNDLIKQTIKAAVKMVTEKEKVIIRINPDDLAQVKAHQKDILLIGGGIGKLEIQSDKNIERGGCVVETEAGNIDARIGSRFAELEKTLKQTFGPNNS